jgi:hypothetical protein
VRILAPRAFLTELVPDATKYNYLTSSGLVEVFSIRSMHPFFKFTPGGFRPGLIPADHARLDAHCRLKPHNFLVPLPDQFAIAGKQDRVGCRFKTCTGGKTAPLDPCRVIEDPVGFSNSTLMLQTSICSSTSRIASPAHASPQPAALTCATVLSMPRRSSAAFLSQSSGADPQC